MTKDITHWSRLRMMSSSSSSSSSSENRQRWKCSQLLCNMCWKVIVLLLSNVHQTQHLRKTIHTYILSRWTKRVIWNDCISRNRWSLWNRKIIELKGRNLRRPSMMRSPAVLRTIQIAIVTFVLACSCMGSLRSVWRCFSPIFSIK